MIPDEKLREIIDAAEKATPGTWVSDEPKEHDQLLGRDECLCTDGPEDDEFTFVAEKVVGGVLGHTHVYQEIHEIHSADGVKVAGNYDYEDGGIISRADRDYILLAQPSTVFDMARDLLDLRAQRDRVLALAEPEPDYWDGAQGYELHEVAGRNELARYIREALSVTRGAETDE